MAESGLTIFLVAVVGLVIIVAVVAVIAAVVGAGAYKNENEQG